MFPSAFVLSVFCAGVVSVVGAGIAKRDDAPFVPARVDLPLMFDASGRYVISVQMGPSRLNLTMTTGSGLTYVAGDACAQCASEGVNLYNETASSTVQKFASTANVPFFNATAGASIIKENCSLPTTGGPLWPYPNQTVAVMNDVTSNVVNQASGANIAGGISGLVGFGTNRGIAAATSNTTYTPNFGDSIMGQWLSVHPTALNFSFGMALDKPVVTPKPASSSAGAISGEASTAGTVHWLQPDHEAYDAGTLAWSNVVNDTQALQGSLATDPQDWVVSLDGWVFVSGGNTINHRLPVTANIDPLYQGIYIPLDLATLIHASIPGAVAQPQVSTLGSLAQTWKLPCDSDFTMGILVSSQTFTLGRDSLVIQNPDGTCTSGLEAWTDAGVNQYLLGARFMSAVYLIFNVPRDGSSSIGFADRAIAGSKSHTGAIVGGTVGGVLGLIIIALVAWYFFYFRPRHAPVRSHSASVDEDKSANTGNVVPYPVFSPTQASHLHSPSSTGFSEAQTIVYNPSSLGRPDSQLTTSPSQAAFIDQMGLYTSPVASPHSPTPLLGEGSAGEGGIIAPPAYEEREGSVAGSTRRERPLEKGRHNEPSSGDN